MPRITTAEPSKFSVSLSKTLIKGLSPVCP